MNKLFVSIVLGFVVVAGLLLYQASRRGTSLVVLPSELSKLEPGKKLSRIRVAGKVAPEGTDYQVQPEIVLKFSIYDPGLSQPADAPVIPVIYRGIRPDMFSPGRDVIIDGEYSDGLLTAGTLLTQCPSKYEAPAPDKLDQYKK